MSMCEWWVRGRCYKNVDRINLKHSFHSIHRNCPLVCHKIQAVKISRNLGECSHHHHHVVLPARISLPPVSVVHCSREVFKATSSIDTELLYIGSSRSSCPCSSMRWSPQEYVAYEFVLTLSAVSRMPSSSNLDSFRDGW